MRGSVLPRGARRAGASLAVLVVSLVAVFATLNAVRSRPEPLSGALESPDAVAEAVLEAMAARDAERLARLVLSEGEFRDHVWPYLPVSRPEVNMPFDVMWGMLRQNSQAYLRQTLAALDGEPPLEVRGVRFAGETSTYGDVRVHRDAELVVGAPDGSERVVRLFGSLIEQNGAWKVFSYVADD